MRSPEIGWLSGLALSEVSASELSHNGIIRWLKENGFISSMSRKGNCWDNAVAESFFHTLKVELIHAEKYTTKNSLKQSVFEYIEVYYNRIRRHSILNSIAPFQYEAQLESVV